MKASFKSVLHPLGLRNINSRTIRHAISKAYLPSFLLALILNANTLVDSIFAGAFFSPLHIAAIGIVLPINMVFTSLLHVFVQGTYANYAAALGRGQRRKCRELFTVGMLYIAVFGTIFSAAAIFLSAPLTALFGAKDEALQTLAVQYLRFTAPSYSFVSATELVILILGIYGYQKSTMLANVISLSCNILFSLGFMHIFPQIGFGALGLGTLFASFSTLLVCYCTALRHKLSVKLHMRLYGLRYERFREMFLCGLSTSLNPIIDGIISGVVNHVIVSSALGAEGLAVYAIVMNFWTLSHVSAAGMDYTISPLFGVCYVSSDKSGLLSAVFTSIRICLLITILWCILILLFSPLLLQFYLSSSVDADIAAVIVQSGVVILFAFAPFYTITFLLSCFFDATDRVGNSVLLSVFPDSVIYPVLLVLLLPSMDFLGIWLALGGSTVIFLALAYLLHMITKRRLRVPVDDLLHLDRGLCAEYPVVDVTIYCDTRDISSQTGQIQSFLRDEQASGRVSYLTALCVDELATDMAAHCTDDDCTPIELKIVSQEDCFQIILCSISKPYNPLDNEYQSDDYAKIGLRMVQIISQKIDYNYIYGTNMIQIRIGK